MGLMLYKLTRSSFYDATDEEIKEHERRYKGIPIFYGFDTYRDDMAILMETLDVIKRDYPNLNNDDTHVWTIQKHESQWCAHHTMLTFMIPAEDFIRLRNSRELHSL